MVRRDNIDLGLWKGVDKSKLVVPIDVHMGRLCKILGLYSRRTVSLSAALQITAPVIQCNGVIQASAVVSGAYNILVPGNLFGL